MCARNTEREREIQHTRTTLTQTHMSHSTHTRRTQHTHTHTTCAHMHTHSQRAHTHTHKNVIRPEIFCFVDMQEFDKVITGGSLNLCEKVLNVMNLSLDVEHAYVLQVI